MSPAARELLWRKAAVLGSLWAASEIILGSFLKNAQVPFAGVLLTGIGVAILVAGHRLWPEKGLLWRAGLVCAAMKSVSPSAILLSPMVAIFAEGVLAELAVRFVGGNAAGYIAAGGLAMSWGLVHKIGKLLLFYGPESLQVYVKGLEKLRDWLGRPGGVWEPLVFLFAVYFAAGAAAALIGMKASAEGEKVPVKKRAADIFKPRRGGGEPGYYSAAFLALHLLAIAGLMTSGRLPLFPAAGLSLVYGLVCAFFYRRASALLSRAGLWTGIAAVSLLAGWLLGDWGSGLRMAARAFAVTLGFAAVAQELMNPRVRAWLEKAAGCGFFDTLEYSFASLPLVLESLPSGRDMALRPAASLRTVIARAPELLDSRGAPVFFVSGPRGSGKSTLIAGMAALMREKGLRPAGILAEGLVENGVRSGFDLVDLSTGARVPLCRRGAASSVKAGEFGFFAEGLAAGEKALSAESLRGADAVFVDEVGFLELEGGGWAPALERLLKKSRVPLILSVRDELSAPVSSRWGIAPAAVLQAGTSPAAAVPRILPR
ncbi:MAG TPA: nucleoside-triphosphatase [Elusimicrobiales bacterium]|nr:nucleoside-triphosphatase [Elusimicrobiales bacterium]